MIEEKEIVLTVVIVTLTILSLIVNFLLLFISGVNRRNKHKVELAELKMNVDEEVSKAEREVTQTILSEIGSELHDNVGQLLTAAQIGLMNKFKDDLPRDQELSLIVQTLEQGVDEISRLGRSLNTDLWQESSIQEAITFEAERLERLNIISVDLSLTEDVILSKEEKIILFRIFQEVVSNAIKHSIATELKIFMSTEPFELIVSDNGIGFEEYTVSKGAGLYNIRHRCELINVEADLKSATGTGSKWTFTKK